MVKISKCPSCGSHRMRRATQDWAGEFKGRRYTVPNVPFDECPDCGEKVFDRDAVRKIQSHRPTASTARLAE